MSFRQRLTYLLVHSLNISHKEAKALIQENKVSVNGIQAQDNVLLHPYDEIWVNGVCVRPEKPYLYYAYYKPIGVECSMRGNAGDSLMAVLPNELRHLNFCGRLDKASEGLLLLTNDGYLVKALTTPAKYLWKTYEVGLEQQVTPQLINGFRQGMLLNHKPTLPAKINQVGPKQVEIALQEGRNKQIRRMCFALGNFVTKLKRTAIGSIYLGQMEVGEYRVLSLEEVVLLRKEAAIC